MGYPNIAVCVGNSYFTGKVKVLGSVFNDSNVKIRRSYILRYPDSFSDEDEFIKADELFFELMIIKVSEWIYKNNIPVGFVEQILWLIYTYRGLFFAHINYCYLIREYV